MTTLWQGRPKLAGPWILLAVLTAMTQGCEPRSAEAPADPEAPVRGSAFLRFGRGRTPQQVPYVVQGEWAVTQGDILLGRVADLEAESARLREELARGETEGNVSASGLGIRDSFYLWDNAVVPFALDSSLSDTQRIEIRAAMDHWERRTVARFTQKSVCNLFENCITFKLSTDNRCNSLVGKLRVAGVPARQDINVAGWCNRTSLIHELGHAMGLWHEHNRSDRDNYISITPWNFQNTPAGENCLEQFTKETDSGKNIHGYDFASIMHYPTTAQNCSATDASGNLLTLYSFVTPPPGGANSVGRGSGLSDGDLNAITAMYGSWVTRKYAEYIQPHLYGYVGAPTSDEGRAKDWGRYQHFQHGSIYWHPDTGAYLVRAAIRSKWEELNWENGVLGYPISDTQELSDGRLVNHFQFGSIYWRADTGHQVMVSDSSGSPYEYLSGIKGHVEGSSSTVGVSGWVYDVHSPSVSIGVHYYMDGPAGSGAPALTATANLARSDVNSVFSIPGNHGFQLPIPAQYYDGQPHTVYVYGIDAQGVTNPVLDGLPHTFTFAGAEGRVEQISGGTVRGWALDLNSKGTSIAVHYYINGPAGSGAQGFAASTSVYRSDINSTYGATGNHGFEFAIPSQYRDGYTHSLYVYAIDAEGRHNPLLDGRSYNFQVGTPPDPEPDPDPDYCNQKPWLCDPDPLR